MKSETRFPQKGENSKAEPTGEAIGVGLITSGVVGALGNLAIIGAGEAGANQSRRYERIFIWLPANGLTFSDSDLPAIRRRVMQEILMPSAERYVNSKEAKRLPSPPSLSEWNDEGIFGSGEWCSATPFNKSNKDLCQLIFAEAIVPVRYANQDDLPFSLNTDTPPSQRYIVVRVSDINHRFYGVTPYLDQPGVFSYIPALSYKADSLKRLAKMSIGHEQVPTVYEGGNVHWFVSPTHRIDVHNK